MKRPTALGIPSPWSGDERDPIRWTYRLWFRLYHAEQRVRHGLGRHTWRNGPIIRRCDWCGATEAGGQS